MRMLIQKAKSELHTRWGGRPSKKGGLTSIQKKFTSQQGESIAEVLVAVLVVAFGALLLATMVTTSFRILNRSEDAFNRYLAGSNVVASEGADGQSTGISGVDASDVGFGIETGKQLDIQVNLPAGSGETPVGTTERVTVYRLIKDGHKVYMDYKLEQ